MTKNSIIKHGVRGLFATGLVATLVACGGGGSSSSDDGDITQGSTPVVARGVITQLGSIWVNGVEYETPDGGSYSDDDSTSTVANYKVGQIVRLRGRRNDDGVSGTANEVEYEAEIEGAASGGAINGVTIIIATNANTSFATLNSGALIDNNRYEVSGVWLDDTIIEATFIKDDDDSDPNDEVKGYVEASTATTLTVRGVTYTYDGTPAVSKGDFVEIHFDPVTLTAPAGGVELEDDFDDRNDGQEVEFEGAVNMDPTDLADCPPGADFLIDMTCIDWDSVPSNGWMDGLTGSADMISGLRVEAEGHFNAAGLLIAEKIKGRGNRVRITSTANVPGTGSADFDLFFGAIQVTVIGGVTEIEPGVAPITDGEGLEVRGVRTGPTSMLALRIKSESVSADRHELRGEVDLDGADPSDNTITVMGVTSVAGSGTELEVEDVQVAPSPGTSITTEAQIDAFLGNIDDDAIVSITNGPRDIVDVRIDTTNGGDGSLGLPYGADQIEIEEEDD